ncbi:uncharacterized protein MICPUCDRAFT_35098 [Micromonas pusilla CCMP1545]|uniref:DIS3-like exonuclease 1 n=1 Tax=Micromonas pusilla (strain CCMP1545) TaxID=564608 RepID=C1N007_MICPC|nr:uncharacterized protein MICPUCDRAFT_35098 [Micromonas pusilla CCMP1545]EEH54962.1 predicted protein [Micromonas pusilla CCMP1545]|eukprot:XP_003061312.1 predicted protein [Micromonas pusilla CCMP1545]
MDVVAPKLRLMTRRGAALCGKRLLARVDGWRRNASHPDARVLSVLGDRGDIETETRCILAVHDVHDAAFTKAALRDLPAEGDAWTVEKSYFADGNPNPRETRRDFRGTKTCSIDPPGCVDVDDAVSVKILPDARGYEIGVHIADVSHFVREGTHLDHEARARGTTTYLVDRRIDMLPGLLSENLCSLVEREDRLAMSCAWTLDADFNVSDTWFGKSVVRSDHQLSYYQAQAIVDGADAADLRVDLDVLRRFAAARRAARTARGAVELSSAELRFETSNDGVPTDVLTKGEVPMMAVIAELMIAANASVATKAREAFPTSAFVRRHAPPRLGGFEELRALVASEGVDVALDASNGEALAGSIERAARRAACPADAGVLFRSIATRAMSEAQYACAGATPPADGGGHYGLALDAYAHFTSPIRRYADVIAHRQLVAALARREGEGDATVDVPYPTTTSSSSSSSSLSRASLTSTATHLNERNRASKRAQTKCAELYLLKVLQTAPAIEPALVIEVKDDGVVVFLPRFHVRGAVRLRRANREDGTSTVALPAKETVFEEETSGTRAGGQVRSIHWSPYDRVRVVNADP